MTNMKEHFKNMLFNMFLQVLKQPAGLYQLALLLIALPYKSVMYETENSCCCTGRKCPFKR